ncbi:hypothetical protein ACSBL2_09345 [Pedobacter sp. AW31-3R]
MNILSDVLFGYQFPAEISFELTFPDETIMNLPLANSNELNEAFS